MLSCSNYDEWAWSFLSRVLFNNFNHLDAVFSDSLPSRLSSYHVLFSWRLLNSIKKFIKIIDSIWITLGYFQCIAFIWCWYGKGEGIVETIGSIYSILVAIILNIASCSEPPLSVFFLCFCREDAGLHSVVKQGIALEHVDDVDFDFSFGGKVCHLEIKPLCVSFWVYIILEKKIVLIFWYLVSSEEIPWLEGGIEVASFFGIRLWSLAWISNLWFFFLKKQKVLLS